VFSAFRVPLPRSLAKTTWLAMALLAPWQDGAAQAQSAGDASIRLEYQFIHTGDFADANTLFTNWTTDSQVALLSADYAITDRWTVYAALPYVQKRFNPKAFLAGAPHNPNDPWWIAFEPPDKRFIDDGEYHGGFQDLSVGVTYLALDGPLTVRPYIGYGYPTDSYPFFGKAAIGLNLWNVPVGVAATYVPYFSDWYFSADVAYVFSEEPLGVNVDYWLGYLAAGYWFKPQFAMNLFLSTKYVRDGLVLPWDFTDDPTYSTFPVGFDTPEWWQHDRLLQHRILNVGIGFDWFINERYQLSGTYFQSVWEAQTTTVENAFTLGLTRYFDRE
jgi:hypothetical protein